MIVAMCREVIRQLGLQVFIETGTESAETVAEVSQWFADLDPRFGRVTGHVSTGAKTMGAWGTRPIRYPVFADAQASAYQVYSIDVTDEFYKDVKELLESNPNIHLVKSSSPVYLRELIQTDLVRRSRAIFYLDAHWGKYWPLRDEIREIIQLDQFVIAIDDFFVPGKSNPAQPRGEYGYDFYGGVILDWGYIRDLFQDQDIRVYYSTRPNRDHRGAVLVFKGYSAEQLSFLAELGTDCVDKNDAAHAQPVRLSPWAYLDTHYLVAQIVPFTWLRRLFRRFELDGKKRGALIPCEPVETAAGHRR